MNKKSQKEFSSPVNPILILTGHPMQLNQTCSELWEMRQKLIQQIICQKSGLAAERGDYKTNVALERLRMNVYSGGTSRGVYSSKNAAFTPKINLWKTVQKTGSNVCPRRYFVQVNWSTRE